MILVLEPWICGVSHVKSIRHNYERRRAVRLSVEEALIDENILDLLEDQGPEIINDRGRQMKAKSIKQMFEDHYMPQLFSRPRTPDDNPFAESLFGTVKTASQYPGRFLDHEEAIAYFIGLHSGIDYVTSEQCHKGLREAIVARQKEQFQHQQHLRKEVNWLHQNALTGNLESLMVNVNQFTVCSVMNL